MKRRFMFGMIMAVATMMAGCAGNSISKQASQEVSTMQTQEITEGTSVEDVTSGSTSPEKSTIAPVENGLWTDGVNEFYVEYDTDLCTCHIREIMKASDDFIIPDEINGYAVTFVNFGEETIQRLTNVTSITIPNSMPEHEFHSYNSLYFLPNVTEYRVKENSPYCVIDGVLYTADRSTLLRCPIKKTGELIVPAETHHLAMEAFYSCENLTSIRFCDNIVADGYWVFVGCSGLTELVLPNWPGAIMVLNGMENIEEIVIANCEYVPFSLAYFSGCDALTTLRFCGTIGSVDVESWGTTGIKDIYCNNSSKDQEMFQPLVDMGIRIHYQLEEMDFAQDYQALENASIEDGIKFVQKYLYPAFTVPKDMKDRIDHMVISINLPEDGSPITSDRLVGCNFYNKEDQDICYVNTNSATYYTYEGSDLLRSLEMLQGHVKDIENYSYELFEGGKKTFVSTMNEEKHEILSEQYIPSDDDNITKTIEKTNGRTITRIRTFDQGVLVKEETYEEVGQYYYNFSGIIDKYGYLLSYTNKSNDNPDDPDSEYYEEGTFETSYQYHEDGSLLSVDLIFPIIISEEEIYIQHNQDIYIYK